MFPNILSTVSFKVGKSLMLKRKHTFVVIAVKFGTTAFNLLFPQKIIYKYLNMSVSILMFLVSKKMGKKIKY